MILNCLKNWEVYLLRTLCYMPFIQLKCLDVSLNQVQLICNK